jgi:hypothetical protein
MKRRENTKQKEMTASGDSKATSNSRTGNFHFTRKTCHQYVGLTLAIFGDYSSPGL